MRQMIAIVILGSALMALAAYLGTAQQPRDDDLARSIARLVETSR